MIELKDGRYFAGIWFVQPGVLGGREVDIQGALWRDVGGPWTLQYRYRYYVDDRIQDSEDEKSWWRGELRSVEDEEEAVRRTTIAFEQMAELMGRTADDVSLVRPRSDVSSEILAILARQPWAHPQMTGQGGSA